MDGRRAPPASSRESDRHRRGFSGLARRIEAGLVEQDQTHDGVASEGQPAREEDLHQHHVECGDRRFLITADRAGGQPARFVCGLQAGGDPVVSIQR